eukprot:7593110-Pyramimonas_sp.AAC.1
MTLRLMCNLRHQCVFYTDYSGFDCPREAMEVCIQGFVQQNNWTFDKPPVIFKRSCDYGLLQQRVLCRVAKEHDQSSTCVFSDIFDRLPEWGKQWVFAAMPSKT